MVTIFYFRPLLIYKLVKSMYGFQVRRIVFINGASDPREEDGPRDSKGITRFQQTVNQSSRRKDVQQEKACSRESHPTLLELRVSAWGGPQEL